jgi:hypothetical protein
VSETAPTYAKGRLRAAILPFPQEIGPFWKILLMNDRFQYIQDIQLLTPNGNCGSTIAVQADLKAIHWIYGL